MERDGLVCRVEQRRRHLFDNPQWNGMDFLDVADNQLSLCVHFFGPVPEGIGVDNVRIEGGRRIRDIGVLKVEIERSEDPELDDCLRVGLDKFGDFSTYRICLVAPDDDQDPVSGAPAYQSYPGIDPRYACLEFNFKVDCPSDLDCKTAAVCPPAAYTTPEINHLAKDYASFRQLMLDRLALTLPAWQERHVPDIGVALVELLAYVADHLSYYQDAVATEAYLDTARQRISVRRHARLVDYAMHEGNNARAWITVSTATDLEPIAAPDIYFITGFTDIEPSSGRVVKHTDLEHIAPDQYEVFEPLLEDPQQTLTWRAAHSEIRFYTWGDTECCLAQGATRASLLDATAPTTTGSHAESPARVLQLQVGDVLIFEEVLGPTTGKAADADPTHRHAVRLTKVTPNVDALLEQRRVLDIEWAAEDALPFSLCLAARLPAPDCRRIADVSVARGNAVLVDHGRSAGAELGPVLGKEAVGECACEDSILEYTEVPLPFRPVLAAAPLGFAEPLPSGAAATRAVRQDPRRALPGVVLQELAAAAAPAGEPVADSGSHLGPIWRPRYDLLASAAADRHFVAEIDDDGQARLRFGDGELGRRPAVGTRFQARYRIGNGPAGNVGRDTIQYLVLRQGTLSADAVLPRNPMAAQGGRAPEDVAEVKLLAPHAFRSQLQRAVTAADYAALAQDNAKLQRAAAELRWTGSWYAARVAIDPLAAHAGAAGLTQEVADALFVYRRMGHDLSVHRAHTVPLDLALEVCVQADHVRGAVQAALLEVFGAGVLADGRRGFFHADQLSFGSGVYVSQLVAAAQGVAGVETVAVRRLKRLHEPLAPAIKTKRQHADGSEYFIDVPHSGVLELTAMEIAQLDNDADFPEHGRLELILRGGR